jgi:F-type H+-transporting ATPase subunit delta
MKAFPEVVRVFGALLDESRQIARVKARLAAPTSEAALAALKARLSAAIGRGVELEPAVDESLLGGAVLVLNDTVLDGSVKGAIQRLRERMRQQ